MKKQWTIRALAMALALCAFSAGDAAAQATNLDNARRARQLTGDIMSPFCRNRTLAECPSPSAEAQRQRVHAWVDAGLTDDEIKARLERELGEVLSRNFQDPGRPAFKPTLAPIPEGPVSWVLPIMLLSFGVVVLGAVLVRLQRKPAAAQAANSSDVHVSAKELRAIEDELEAELEARGIGGRPPRA